MPDDAQGKPNAQVSEENKLSISILLAEYNSLRAEAIARGGHFYQTVALGGTAVTFVIGTIITWLNYIEKLSSTFFWISVGLIGTAIAIATIVLGILLWLVRRDLEKCAARIRELEIEVNARAGEDLLIWENLWGGSETGYWGFARPLRRGKLSAIVRPERSQRGRFIT